MTMGQSFNKFQCTNEETTPRVHFKEYYIYVYISKNVTRNSNKGIHIYINNITSVHQKGQPSEKFSTDGGELFYFLREK